MRGCLFSGTQSFGVTWRAVGRSVELARLWVSGSPPLASELLLGAGDGGPSLIGCSFVERRNQFRSACVFEDLLCVRHSTRSWGHQDDQSTVSVLRQLGVLEETGTQTIPVCPQRGQGLGGRRGQSQQKTDCICEPWVLFLKQMTNQQR